MYANLQHSDKYPYEAKQEFEHTFLKYVVKIVRHLEVTFKIYKENHMIKLNVREATLRLSVSQLLIDITRTFGSIEFQDVTLSVIVD
jgi:hypothetical protein